MNAIVLKGFNDEIDCSKINISSLRKLDNGGQMAGVAYTDSSKKLVIQTPLMSIPYNFGTGFNGDRSDHLSLSFGDINGDAKLNKFHSNMKNIETEIINHAIKNNESWFPNSTGKSKEFIDQLIEDAFNPFVQQKNTKYPPTMKIKIPYENDKYNISIFDLKTNEEYDFNLIKDKLKGSYVKICFRVTGIYNINKHFGLSAKATKIKISFPIKDEDDFRSDSDDDLANLNNKLMKEVVEDDIDDEIKKEVTNKLMNMKPKDSEDEDEDDDDSVEDIKPTPSNQDDDDDDDDDDDEDDEPVAKVVKKKTTTKKVKK